MLLFELEVASELIMLLELTWLENELDREELSGGMLEVELLDTDELFTEPVEVDDVPLCSEDSGLLEPPLPHAASAAEQIIKGSSLEYWAATR